MSDAELVARAKVGNRQAQALLCERSWRTVQRLARKLAGSTEAEDIAQEVFARAFASLHALRDASAFRSWVCGITAHVARRQYRRRSLQCSLIAACANSPVRHWDELVPAEATVQLKEVAKRLDRLRARQREAIWLHRLEGRTSVETARVLGVSLSSVKRWLSEVDRRLEGSAAPRASYDAGGKQ